MQKEYYNQEILLLKDNKSVHKSSTLVKLNPFLDQHEILRVGGRLQESSMLNYEEKHPIIIPKSAHITTLLVRHHHTLIGHQGRDATLAHIRSHGL